MKITGINIPENFESKGLKAINLSRFGEIVVIAGKNGSGKTRLLDILVRHANSCILDGNTKRSIIQSKEQYENALKTQSSHPDSEQWKKVITQHEEALEKNSYFQRDQEEQKINTVPFVPKGLHLSASKDTTPNNRKNAHNTAKHFANITNMHQNTLLYIAQEYDYNEYATHPNNVEDPECESLKKSFASLNDLIELFLGVRLGRDKDGCTLFGLDIDKAALSDGQKVLLQLCVMLHAQNASLDNVILILDEPENHLHPEAQIEFVSKIREVLKNGQIWIATHSVHILSHVDVKDVYYMEDGALTYAGKTPEKVLRGLVGNEDRVEKLRNFIDLPEQLAITQFTYECLFPPRIAETGSNDPQMTQIHAILRDFISENGIIRILDYGAGRGRLLAACYENESDKASFGSRFDYRAFDDTSSSAEVSKQCQEIISNVHGTLDKRYFTTHENIFSEIDEKTIDIIVMCNVLHEIEPKHWIEIFKSSSAINYALSDDGYLLLVEDNAIPTGEKPNKDGFFVLGKSELKMLFEIIESDKICSISYKDENRLYAHLIPKQYLGNISEETVHNALSTLKENVKEKIRKIRRDSDCLTYKIAKESAFLIQQLANIILYDTSE